MSPYDDIRLRIAEHTVDLVSFDVFDTLVWRPVAAPHQLFVRLAHELIAKGLVRGHVTVDDFVAGRRRAERDARTASQLTTGYRECTLDEIWDRMPAPWLVEPPSDRATFVDAELALEGEQLRRIDEASELLAEAHQAGITTALVSDTYFSTAQLRYLLGGAGVPLDAVDRIEVSCEAGLAKYDGLLANVVAACVDDPGRAVHLGDNPVADVEAAQAAGAVGVLADVEPRWAPEVLKAVRHHSARSGNDMGITALTRATLLATPDGADADYQFGVTVGAPVMHGCARWISATATDLGVTTVHCLLREGGVIADLVNTVRPDGPTAKPVHASRWVNLRAAVLTGSPAELFRAIARKAELEASHVTQAFGVDHRLVESVIGAGVINDLDRAEAIQQMADHDELRGAVIESSSDIRSRLMRYLDAVLDLTDGRLVVSDIGWGGTIQEALGEILVHEGRLASTEDVTGLYLMLSQAGLERRFAGQRLLSYLPARGYTDRELTVIARNPELLEQLCTPDEGTLLDIDESGSPITAEHDPTMTRSRLVAQRGLIDGVRRLSTFEQRARTEGDSDLDPWLDDGLRAELLTGLAATLQAPGAELARTLSTWLHDDIAGQEVVPLAEPDRLGFLEFVNAAEISTIDMRDVFWLPGAAATNNPTLVEQLAATQRGADVDNLCPPSTAGQASIAVFEPDNDEAVALTRPIPRTGAHGRSYMRLSASITAARDIRIDFGDVDHLVELDHLEVRFGGDATPWRIERVDDQRVRWIGGRTVSPSIAAVTAGGYALVPVPNALARATRIDVRCAFRVTALDQADAAALLRVNVAGRARLAAVWALTSLRK